MRGGGQLDSACSLQRDGRMRRRTVHSGPACCWSIRLFRPKAGAVLFLPSSRRDQSPRKIYSILISRRAIAQL